MEQREAVLVDAFAPEPTGGLPIAVLPDGVDLADDQLAAAASELATDVAVPVPAGDTPERLRVVGPGGSHDRDVAPLVAALALATERGDIDPGAVSVTTPAGARETRVEDDGRVWVDLEDGPSEEIDLDDERLAGALGVDVATLRDVGSDLPPTRIATGVEALVVPVNFLEHLGSLSPDPAALTALMAQADVEAVCAFTFDTLNAESACHARTFVPGAKGRTRSRGLEVPVTPRIAAGCVRSLARRGTIEADVPAAEQGHFLNRPARVDVRVTDGQVGGRAVASFDGTATVPPADEDDIIEV